MTNDPFRPLRFTAATVIVLSALASHLAIAMGQAYGVAVALAALSGAASGAVVWSSLPRRRWVGPLVSAVLLAALALGAGRSPQVALLAEAGAAHAVLYLGLLAVFAATLRPGHVALVTWFAARINPHFHAGQVAYTRAVTWAWVLVFLGQLAASAVLLAADRALWQGFVTGLHIPVVVAVALAEAGVRRWRWRHEHATGFVETVRGVRRLLRQPAARSSMSR